jgi:HD-GYP domain-containing protein (c-di-GMP phosphodiesterase class II)
VRLTDLIRGAKAAPEEPKREPREDKAASSDPAETRAPSVEEKAAVLHPTAPVPSQAVESSASESKPVPPAQSAEPSPPSPVKVVPPVAQEASETPIRSVKEPAESQTVAAPAAPAMQHSPSFASVPPMAPPAQKVETATIQLRLSQSAPREATPRAGAPDSQQIQLRALSRLPRQSPAPPLAEPRSVARTVVEVSPYRVSARTVQPGPVQPVEAEPVPSIPSARAEQPPVADPPAIVEPTPLVEAEQPRPQKAEPHGKHETVEASAQVDRVEKTAKAELDWYGLAEAELAGLAIAIRNRQPFTLDEIGRIATGMVEALEDSDRLLMRAFTGQKSSPLITNMVNVGIFSVKLGRGLGYQTHDLVRLCQAGLVHDVGMFLLPELLIMKPEKFGTQDLSMIRQHPDLGYQILSKLGTQYEWLAQIVWQEHERCSGLGYPRGLKEAQIHEYARIIGLCDVFEALLSPRPYRARLLPHIAMRELLATEKQSFPHRLMKILVEQFSVFPLGTSVRLNTGETGIVTQLNPRHPLRPIVQITQLADRTIPPAMKLVDLSKTTLVHVAMIETEAAA